MCTAITYKTKDHYFGRTLDLDRINGAHIVLTPRQFPLAFRKKDTFQTHHAIIGMAVVAEEYPLYFDATNEKGLSMAGLNFPGNADYKEEQPDKDNITPFEFIPWILGQCSNLSEVRKLLGRINLVNIDFSQKILLSPLHWIIADREAAIVVESVKEGLRIYDDPMGVLTNNPTFDFHLWNLNNYMTLTPEPPTNQFSDKLDLQPCSLGMGALGLPGDLSSSSRFVRATFTKMNSRSGESEEESVNQFFHILGTVAQIRGCAVKSPGIYEITCYTSCCNTDRGIYYYTTYENSRISGVDMQREDLEGNALIEWPLMEGAQILMQN